MLHSSVGEVAGAARRTESEFVFVDMERTIHIGVYAAKCGTDVSSYDVVVGGLEFNLFGRILKDSD
jgi:hypothetical protein